MPELTYELLERTTVLNKQAVDVVSAEKRKQEAHAASVIHHEVAVVRGRLLSAAEAARAEEAAAAEAARAKAAAEAAAGQRHAEQCKQVRVELKQAQGVLH
eukprot:4086236-Prymnesium_polylepis.1